jgi:autotransporter-associated beta strand protein
LVHGGATTRTIDASGAGLLKFTSVFTSSGTVGSSTTILTGTGNGEIVHGLPFAVNNLTKSGAGTWTLGGEVGVSGATTISNSGGTLRINGMGSLLGGNYSGTISIGSSGRLQYSSSANQTLGGVISGDGALTKDTSSTSILNLTGTNTYKGATTVTSGTLLVNGNSTLATGAGTVGGATTVNGNLKPGNSPGVLSFASTLDLAGTSTSTFEIDGLTRGTQYDGVNTTGALTYGGILTLDFGMIFGAGTHTFDLFQIGGGESSDFSQVNLAGSYGVGALDFDSSNVWQRIDGDNTWTFTQSTGDLQLTVIPEPSVALLSGLGLLALFRRSRV